MAESEHAETGENNLTPWKRSRRTAQRNYAANSQAPSSSSICIHDENTVPSQRRKRPKTAGEMNRAYRARLLADPLRAQIYRETSKQRNKLYRQNATPEMKQAMNEGARKRMAAYRERLRKAGLTSKNNPWTGPDDQQRHELSMAKWAEAKRRWRAKLTPQERMLFNQRRRERRAAQKELERQMREKEVLMGGDVALMTSEGSSVVVPEGSLVVKTEGSSEEPPAGILHDKLSGELSRRDTLQKSQGGLSVLKQFGAVMEGLKAAPSPRKRDVPAKNHQKSVTIPVEMGVPFSIPEQVWCAFPEASQSPGAAASQSIPTAADVQPPSPSLPTDELPFTTNDVSARKCQPCEALLPERTHRVLSSGDFDTAALEKTKLLLEIEKLKAEREKLITENRCLKEEEEILKLKKEVLLLKKLKLQKETEAGL